MVPPLSLTAQAQDAAFLALQGRAHVYAIYSDWQLREVMTRFWNDHFNRSFSVIRFSPYFYLLSPPPPAGIDGDDYATWFLQQDDDFFRANAFGTFRNLLGHVSGSVSMLLYLDNYLNAAGASNQNWARELCELFTMGEVNASTGVRNYVQADVLEVARCFTGWTVTNSATAPPLVSATFNNAIHDTGGKSIFQTIHPPATTPVHPLTVLAGGTAQFDGDRVLDHLASIDATKDFVIRKLMVLFFGENVVAAPMAANYQAMLASAKVAWGQFGDIQAVLNVLLTSTEFTGAAEQWQKVKSPLHATASLARCFVASPDWGAGPDHWTLYMPAYFVEIMGQPLFSFETPDGFPMSNSEQMAVSGLADRALSGERLFPDVGDPGFDLFLATGLLVDFLFDPALDVAAEMTNEGLDPSDATHIAGFLMRRVYGDRPLPAEVNRIAAELLLPGPLPPAGSGAWGHHLRVACELLASFTYFSLY
jgi:uncharacterized protein (DUF1800 family)